MHGAHRHNSVLGRTGVSSTNAQAAGGLPPQPFQSSGRSRQGTSILDGRVEERGLLCFPRAASSSSRGLEDMEEEERGGQRSTWNATLPQTIICGLI